MKKDLRIGEILLNAKVITEAQLNEALGIQHKEKKRLGEILIEKGFVAENILGETLAAQFRIPFVDLTQEEIDKEAVGMLSTAVLKKYRIFPLRLKENRLVIAATDPSDIATIQEISRISGCSIKLVIASLSQIDAYINKYSWSMQCTAEMVEDVSAKEKVIDIPSVSLEKMQEVSQDSPVMKLVNNIISDAISRGVSDIHFEPMEKELLVRFRIDGVLYNKVNIASSLQAQLISRIKILAGMDIAERRKPQDGRMRISAEGKDFNVRVSTLPGMFGEQVVLRLLDKKSILLSLDSLGMDQGELQMFNSLIYKPYGIILITGPTGSGKTTTLYSILNTLNDGTRNIITIEDPIEYELPRVNQTSVNLLAGYTFATAIKHVLRQDPDIIMVGEIRDPETADIAIQAALTGHLVLSTLHTNNAVGAISRLLDMNIESYLISSAIIGVIAQRLVRKLCPFCSKERDVPKSVKEKVADLIPSPGDKLILAQPVGCEKCRNIGYSKRVGIFEILTVSEEIRNMIVKKNDEEDITKAAVSQGMRSLREAGVRKALNKITSLEEVMRIVSLDKA